MLFLLSLNICLSLHVLHAEVFSAIVDLEKLLDTLKTIIDDLTLYVDMQENKLFTMKGYLNLYSNGHVRATKHISTNYLDNDFNFYILTKRLVSDLDYFKRMKSKGSEYVLNVINGYEDSIYPDNNDLAGAAVGLGRIQITYRLDVRDLANGNLNNIAYSSAMTASDCYVVGQALKFKNIYLKAGLAFMKEALRKYEIENVSYPFDENDIMDYIRNYNYILVNENDDDEDVESHDEDAEPHDEDVEPDNGADEYENEIINNEKENKPTDNSNHVNSEREDSFEVYYSLCRGQSFLPIKQSSRLKCRYLKENHPFLKLAPFKVEMLYLNPDIFLFHDVLSDSEIEEIKALGIPSLHRATAVDDKTDRSVIVNFRISKTAWLKDRDSEVCARMSQRVSDMSGLSMENAEELQLCNYGIGGHYEPHTDVGLTFENDSAPRYDRIATALFYMSDVEQGGATVFTELGLTIYPKKGSALFWFNMDHAGYRDSNTRHAACPVLQGSKWVFTKWIHNIGQEFRRLCNLKR